ncbi:hypothetical protein SteCoe_17131 [Stentor coeruleus]|uniref:Band 7 domain-containing protein n=1 Tax=Stentor coeruleus TaxID=5963 RepID=A0A1R2BZP9_9CILI|nr:hypothetical protein SteCoe_17131 [Stentor coeruleus]
MLVKNKIGWRTMHLMLKMVPQQTAIVVERLGRFNRVLSPGLNFLWPILDYCEYTHSLKEEVYQISNQMAITKDSVTLHLDGVLYLKVTDPKKASYGVGDPVLAMIQIAQTTMRSELGKFTLDQTFEERENLNAAIVNIINSAGHDWGIECMRYEIRDITPPANIKKAMELEGEAERQKRADILDSEKKRAAEINLAEGKKMASILKAEGEAQAVILKAKSVAESINTVSKAINEKGGENVIKMKLAEEYVNAFKKLSEENNAVIVPGESQGIASLVAQALGIIKPQLSQDTKMHQEVRSTVKKVVKSDPILDSTD